MFGWRDGVVLGFERSLVGIWSVVGEGLWLMDGPDCIVAHIGCFFISVGQRLFLLGDYRDI